MKQCIYKVTRITNISLLIVEFLVPLFHALFDKVVITLY
jgi:hypothetical protein